MNNKQFLKTHRMTVDFTATPTRMIRLLVGFPKGDVRVIFEMPDSPRGPFEIYGKGRAEAEFTPVEYGTHRWLQADEKDRLKTVILTGIRAVPEDREMTQSEFVRTVGIALASKAREVLSYLEAQ